MKNIRVIGIGMILSWVIAQWIYIPFTEWFMNTPNFAFISVWQSVRSGSDFLFYLSLVASLWMLSISIGMLISSIFYVYLEARILTLIMYYKK